LEWESDENENENGNGNGDGDNWGDDASDIDSNYNPFEDEIRAASDERVANAEAEKAAGASSDDGKEGSEAGNSGLCINCLCVCRYSVV
jgi:hypothetical protein